MNKKIKVMIVIGTRPEAIKMTPVIKEFKSRDIFDVLVVNTAQHRELVDGFLLRHKIKPDVDFDMMEVNQEPLLILHRGTDAFEKLFKIAKPDLLIVQGDTTTAMTAALVACYSKIPVGHIEAGLRTYDINNPYPEELNRQLISKMARFHFAPTELAKQNLLGEGCNKNNIYVTGNPGIDMLYQTIEVPTKVRPEHPLGYLDLENASNKIVLITIHRRENQGPPLRNICAAIQELIIRHKNLLIIWTVHPNPNISETVYDLLEEQENIILTQPLNYFDFVQVLQLAHLILTDSGGLQEEAVTLGKPVLVLRENTERQEALSIGAIKIIGTKYGRILSAVDTLLNILENSPHPFSKEKIFGDGTASKQIADIISSIYKGKI